MIARHASVVGAAVGDKDGETVGPFVGTLVGIAVGVYDSQAPDAPGDSSLASDSSSVVTNPVRHMLESESQPHVPATDP